MTLNRKYPDAADGSKGPHGPAQRDVEGTHGQLVQGHNPYFYKEPRQHGKHLIVASEPTTYKKCEWNLVEKNHCVAVEGDGNVKIHEMSCSM